MHVYIYLALYTLVAVSFIALCEGRDASARVCKTNAPMPFHWVQHTYRSPADYHLCNTSHARPEYNYNVSIGESLLKAALPTQVSYRTHGLKTLMRKLQCKEPIHIVIMGGSFTKGAGVLKGGARSTTMWSGRVGTWFKAAFPHSDIRVHNYAQGSTTSFYAMHLFRHNIKLKSHPMDLLIVDYTINDDGSSEQSRIKTAHITEAIIRYVHENHGNTALLYFGTNALSKWSENPGRIQQQVCAAYGVHMLSYTRAIYDLRVACLSQNVSLPNFTESEYCRVAPYSPRKILFTLWDGKVHPVEATHRLVAQAVNYYFLHVIKLYMKKGRKLDNVTRTANMPVYPVKPIFALPQKAQFDSQLAESTCTTTLTDMSSIGSDDETNFALIENSFPPVAVNHWKLQRDRPGKPYGWIAETLPKTPSDTMLTSSRNVSIVFSVLFIEGSLSITYLSSYRNSGIFEVFLGGFNYESNGGISKAGISGPDVLRK